MRTATLLPDADALHLEELVADDAGVIVVVTTRGDRACCPDCGQPSSRLHSRKRRQLADLPWQGLAVRLDLQLRRFYCRTPTCERRTFTERLPAVVAPYARRTARLAAVLEAVAFALGGEAGARLLAALGLRASPDTLLRAVHAAPLPDAPTPRVLGVDDWAGKRGRTYGTILVDLERHRPVDLLPDRTADSLATWLREHPGVEIVSRDRGGAYAEGARQGAPDAVQVADRFHLLKNLGDALERLLQRRHAALAEVARTLTRRAADAAAPVLPPGPEPPVSAPALAPTRGERDKERRRARRVARYEQVRELRREGLGLRAIARQLGLGRETVRRFLRADAFPERRERAPRPTALTPHEPYLRERWAAGCHNAAALHRELQARGFVGSVSLVRRFLGAWRTTPARRGRAARQVQPPATPPPARVRALSPRRATWLLLRAEADLAPPQQAYRAQLEAGCPEVAAARALADEFARLIRGRDAAALGPWLARAEGCDVAELREFAAGLRRDQAAVTAALRHEWSNGQVEGQVNRLKLLKRTMYGRAGFALLRRRVLRAA